MGEVGPVSTAVDLITEPGVYDLPADVYHRDPVAGGSLSSSGARKLLPPSCPALYRAWKDGEPEHAPHFDFGRAAHRTVLGVGDDIVVIKGTGKDPNAWRTNEDKAAVDAARAAGKTPITPADAELVDAMAAALREHPIAAALLHPSTGRAEQTLVWRDAETGVWCRALVDWLRHPTPGRPLWVVDFKTARTADPDGVAKAVADYGYHKQGAWYCDGAEALGLSAGPPAFLLVVQMKTPPYLVATYQLRPDELDRGRVFNRKALHVYRDCVERDRWPGFADDAVLPLSLPPWAQIQHDAAHFRGDFDPEGATL